MFENIYIKKADKLNISPNFIKKALAHNNTDALKLVRASKNTWEYQINIEGELYNNKESRPSDFTYLMGLQFGVYNRYQAVELSENVKKQVVMARPNREKTQEVLKSNTNAIANYLCTQYVLDKSYIFQTIDEMFEVHKKNPNFDNEIALDIGKMIAAYYMCFQRTTIKTNSKMIYDFFDSGQAMDYFNLHNKTEFHQKK